MGDVISSLLAHCLFGVSFRVWPASLVRTAPYGIVTVGRRLGRLPLAVA